MFESVSDPVKQQPKPHLFLCFLFFKSNPKPHLSLCFLFFKSMTTPSKYDVFLSFRGDDTRYGFISHLHKALRDKQIEAFVDHELNRGDKISQALVKAIEESQISVVIFSKNYAGSTWCLEELVQILECKKKGKQIVIPVYYHIDRSVVTNQTDTFAAALSKHEECCGNSSVMKWKNALTEAGSLSGVMTSDFK